ncbi:MAG: M20/M25/M40 family metallo-hydrolase [Pseudomonadota bacterium]
MKTILTAVIIGIAAFFSLASLTPPLPQGPAEERHLAALKAHVADLARDRHPIGSQAIKRHRDELVDYLERLGLSVSVQRAKVLYEHPRWGKQPRVAWVENILALLDVPESDGAFAVMSHYDSVAYGPGAADASSGIAAILEAAKALTEGPTPKRDVLFLLTDGEEQGLLGAQGFFRQHPLAKDIDLIINLEARGAAGPAFMFETSAGNASLIRALREGNSHTIANSLSYEVYKHMPNDTDATIALGQGKKLLNFAFIDDYPRYHTMMDNPDILSDTSLFHIGSQAKALTQYFAYTDHWDFEEADVTYFNVLGGYWVSYGTTMLYSLFSLTMLLSVVAVFRLRASALAFGVLGTIQALVTLLVLIAFASSLFQVFVDWRMKGSSYNDSLSWGYLYQHKAYLLAFSASLLGFMTWGASTLRKVTSWVPWLTVCALLVGLGILSGSVTRTVVLAIALLLVVLWARSSPLSDSSVLTGAVVLWMVLAAVLTYALPHASYIATWTLLPLVVLTIIQPGWFNTLYGPILLSILLCLIWTPIVYTFYLGLGIWQPQLPMLILGLVAAILCCSAWRGSSVVLVVGLIGILIAWQGEGFDELHPRPSQLFYAFDETTGDTYWVADSDRSPWTSAVLNGTVEQGKWSRFVPGSTSDIILTNAPKTKLSGVRIETLAARQSDEGRSVKVLLKADAGVESLSLWLESELGTVSVDDVVMPNTRGGPYTRVRFYGLPTEGVELTFELKSLGPISVVTTEQSVGWPGDIEPAPPRPSNEMLKPYSYSDSTIITNRHEI